jgi:hypothetical protein
VSPGYERPKVAMLRRIVDSAAVIAASVAERASTAAALVPEAGEGDVMERILRR